MVERTRAGGVCDDQLKYYPARARKSCLFCGEWDMEEMCNKWWQLGNRTFEGKRQ